MAVATRVTRAERLRQIVELRQQGLSVKQVADQLGLARTSVGNLLADPDGSKQRERRKRYEGVCVECGGPTQGADGFKSATLRCKWCAQGKVPPAALRPRLRVPVRLADLPLEVRLEGAQAANRVEQDPQERVEILFAAMFPSEHVYWVSESARPLLEQIAAA